MVEIVLYIVGYGGTMCEVSEKERKALRKQLEPYLKEVDAGEILYFRMDPDISRHYFSGKMVPIQTNIRTLTIRYEDKDA